MELGKRTTAGKKKILTFNGVDYTFCWCPAGKFLMGSPAIEKDRDYDEHQHEVKLTRGFWMLDTPVTQEMWKSVMGSNPSEFKGDSLPVEKVSWYDCQDFIAKLNSTFDSKLQFRLPSEAEWEYACRAGTITAYNFGKKLNGDNANCNGKMPYGTRTKGAFLEKTTNVRSYVPNAWGLYDMHGNVWEWCLDNYSYYPYGPVTNPMGAKEDVFPSIRGGSWSSFASVCRSAIRRWRFPTVRHNVLGFRLAANSVKR